MAQAWQAAPEGRPEMSCQPSNTCPLAPCPDVGVASPDMDREQEGIIAGRLRGSGSVPPSKCSSAQGAPSLRRHEGVTSAPLWLNLRLRHDCVFPRILWPKRGSHGPILSGFPRSDPLRVLRPACGGAYSPETAMRRALGPDASGQRALPSGRAACACRNPPLFRVSRLVSAGATRTGQSPSQA